MMIKKTRGEPVGRISEMEVGDVRYCAPWALQKEYLGYSLRGDFPAFREYGGSATMKVFRHVDGYDVTTTAVPIYIPLSRVMPGLARKEPEPPEMKRRVVIGRVGKETMTLWCDSTTAKKLSRFGILVGDSGLCVLYFDPRYDRDEIITYIKSL